MICCTCEHITTFQNKSYTQLALMLAFTGWKYPTFLNVRQKTEQHQSASSEKQDGLHTFQFIKIIFFAERHPRTKKI